MDKHNINWKLWQKKFGGKYLGHVSRIFSWLLERKTDLTRLDITKLPRLFYSVSETKTAPQPKQVAFHPESKLAFVSCMEGKKLQVFDCSQDSLKLVNEIPFKEQCVEVAIYNNLCLVTLSKFSRIPGATDNLAIIDIESRRVLSIVNTGGNWSKVIRMHPSGLTFVSNWRSNNLSIIDISDPSRPELVQLLACGISPRGMCFTKSGRLGLVVGFYSRNIIEISQKSSKSFEISFIGDPYDFPKFSGSMRDIIIDSDDQFAYISNLGRNLIHIYHIPSRSIIDSILVGERPNSIKFFDSTEKNLLVSCRESNAVCLLDIKSRKVEGCTEPEIKKSTGLSNYPGGFLVTSFKEALLSIYKTNNNSSDSGRLS